VTPLSDHFAQLPPPTTEPISDRSGTENRPTQAPASVGELAARLGDQLPRLVRDELTLAQIEAKQRVKKAGLGAGLVGAGGGFAFFGACCGVAAAVLGLMNVMRPWAAAITAGIVLFLLAGLIALPGRKVLTSRWPPMPRESIESVKADVSAVRGGWGLPRGAGERR
jgi:hypothetical protein